MQKENDSDDKNYGVETELQSPTIFSNKVWSLIIMLMKSFETLCIIIEFW